MDSAQSDASRSQSGIKLNTTLPDSSSPQLGSSASSPSENPVSGTASYYQPPSGQASVEPASASSAPTPAPSIPSRPAMGEVTPAPGSPVLGASPAAARPGVPTMGMNPAPAAAGFPAVPTSAATATTPPTVANDAMSNQVQQRMQNANAGAGAGKKRSLLLPILGVVVLIALAAAGAFWWWNNQQTATAELPARNEQAVQVPPNDEVPPTVTEGVVEREDSLAYITATETVAEEDPNTAKVFGLACKYEDIYPGGTVLFYQPESESMYRASIPQGENVYSITVPAGQYTAFFEPSPANLPIFAFTEYVNCGLDPNACTDHSLAVFTVEAGQEYGQVDLCDPQYPQEGLPTELQYENS